MTKPKGGKTQTTTQNQSTNFPQWSQDALQGLVGAGAALNAPFIQPTDYAVAGMNADQMKAFDLARQGAQSAFTGEPTQVSGPTSATAARLGSTTLAAQPQGSSPALMQAFTADPVVMRAFSADPAMMQAMAANAQQTNGDAIQALMNPYLQSVVDPAVKRAGRSRDENQAAIGLRSAASGSFGGSREALQRGQADRAYQESTTELVGKLMAQGYDAASALAQANTQLRQQTELTNTANRQQAESTNTANRQQTNIYNATNKQQAEANNTANRQQTNMFNASNGQQASQFNASQSQQNDQFLAQLRQQIALANQSAQNQSTLAQGGYDQQAAMQNATIGMDRARLEDAFRSSDQQRQMSALQQLLGIGNQQQLFAQNVLDTPFNALQRLAALTPQQLNSTGTSTSTQPNNNPSPLQSILGAGMSLAALPATGGGSVGAGLLGRLSDENEKTNVQKLGKDPDTGLMTYAYDYKDDVRKAKRDGTAMPPKRVGPMAQHVEKAAPGSTKRIGGKLAIVLGD